MILDPSDPSGTGLFSKCARNHASKLKSHYRPTSTSLQPKGKSQEIPKRKSRAQVGFSKQTSREQREKMYQSGEVPPVGHYHPVLKQQPKLVWDILKAYSQQKTATRRQPEQPEVVERRKESEKIAEGQQDELG
jgi:hypothetical protein